MKGRVLTCLCSVKTCDLKEELLYETRSDQKIPFPQTLCVSLLLLYRRRGTPRAMAHLANLADSLTLAINISLTALAVFIKILLSIIKVRFITLKLIIYL